MSRRCSIIVLLLGLGLGNIDKAVLGQPTLAPSIESVAILTDPSRRKCDETLGIVTADTVKLAGRRVLEQFLTGELLERSMNIVFRPVSGNFRVVKLCASCKNHHDWYFYRNGKTFPGHHATYCDVNTTGYTVPHSALAFLPVDAADNLPDLVRLRTFVSMAPQRLDPKSAPSAAFPVGEALDQLLSLSANHTATTNAFLTTYLPAMVAASAGSAALFPDPAGTGASENLVHRTMYHGRNYDRITAVSYLALERYLFDSTDQCTLLDKTVTVHGTDDGAFGALYATQLLQRFNIDSLTTFVQAGPLHLEKWFHRALTMDLSNFTTAHEWMRMAALTYSSEIDFIRNTGSNTYLASTAWRDALLKAYGPNSTDRNSVVFPANPVELLNEEIRTFLQTPNATCAERPASLLCSVILEASAYRVMLGETDRGWAYPLNTCYSGADELVGLEQLDDARLTTDVNLQGLWEQYTGPKGGFDDLSIGNATNHETTLLLCSIAPTLFYTLQRHRPDDPNNWPQRQVPMNDVELEQCDLLRNMPTLSPIIFDGPSGGRPPTAPVAVDSPSLQVQPAKAPAAPSPQVPTATGGGGGGDPPASAPSSSSSSDPESPTDEKSPTATSGPPPSSSNKLGASLFLVSVLMALGTFLPRQ
jgi:hypothetical protein